MEDNQEQIPSRSESLLKRNRGLIAIVTGLIGITSYMSYSENKDKPLPTPVSSQAPDEFKVGIPERTFDEKN
jgi:hypothetical protein